MKNLLSRIWILLIAMPTATWSQTVFESDAMKINQITENTYVHITYLNTEEYGLVACNGMLVINGGEAIVFDTPSYDSVATELIQWIESEKQAEVKGVVVNHHHIDCLGGLGVFHERGIPSYASNTTINLALKDGVETPKIGFSEVLRLKAGKIPIENRFFGEAHTKGNIASYVKKEDILFGGCMVKSLKAGRGNINDANLEEWSNTIDQIIEEYPKLTTVIPGHGPVGQKNLLEYTAGMFKQ